MDSLYDSYTEFFFSFNFFKKISTIVVFLENNFITSSDLIFYYDLFDNFSYSFVNFLFDMNSSKLYGYFMTDFTNYLFCLFDA